MKRTIKLYAAAAGVLIMGAAARADQPQDRIAELEAKVAALEAKQTQGGKDLATTIESVLRDAERRSQLLATSGEMSAGYQDGFFIRSGDNWVLKPGAQFQFRQVTNFREDVGGDDTIESGFEVRRMKLSLGGTALTPKLTYYFQWATNRDTDSGTGAFAGSMFLEDAWAKYMFTENWGVRGGQYKDPVFHEELTSSKRQLATERSMVNELIGGGLTGYTQGVSLIYGNYNKDNPINAELAYTDGADDDNTNFVDKLWDFGVAGRVEWKVTGDWKSYQDFSAKGNKSDLLVLGAGGDWSQSGDFDRLLGTLDVQWENQQGLGAYGALLVRDIDSSGDNVTDWGGLVQVGYMLAPAWEVFGRYDVTIFDVDPILNEDTFHEIAVGFNYFLGTNGEAFHRAKFTVDLLYLPNGAPKSISGNGILDANDGEDEWVLRTQFQLLI